MATSPASSEETPTQRPLPPPSPRRGPFTRKHPVFQFAKLFLFGLKMYLCFIIIYLVIMFFVTDAIKKKYPGVTPIHRAGVLLMMYGSLIFECASLIAIGYESYYGVICFMACYFAGVMFVNYPEVQAAFLLLLTITLYYAVSLLYVEETDVEKSKADEEGPATPTADERSRRRPLQRGSFTRRHPVFQFIKQYLFGYKLFCLVLIVQFAFESTFTDGLKERYPDVTPIKVAVILLLAYGCFVAECAALIAIWYESYWGVCFFTALYFVAVVLVHQELVDNLSLDLLLIPSIIVMHSTTSLFYAVALHFVEKKEDDQAAATPTAASSENP